jgi:hypothetical protein
LGISPQKFSTSGKLFDEKLFSTKIEKPLDSVARGEYLPPPNRDAHGLATDAGRLRMDAVTRRPGDTKISG